MPDEPYFIFSNGAGVLRDDKKEISGSKCDGSLSQGMLASNSRLRSDSVAPPPARRCRPRTALVLGCVLVVSGAYYFCPKVFAQTSASQSAEDRANSWTATTDLKSDDLGPQRIPVRIIESHSQSGNRRLDKRSVEIRSTDGHFEPYQDIETETQTVDAVTVRTTTRTFTRNVNGERAFVQVTEEEKHILQGDNSNTVRVTYNPDVNGHLQLVERDIVETKRVENDLQETNTTVMLASVYGGLAPAFKTRELRKRTANDLVETEKTTWIPDINGKWQVNEVRKATATQGETDRTTEEHVSRLDFEGKLGEVSHVVSKESERTTGEKRSVVETYSIDVPGTPRDGSSHMVERKTSTESSNSDGRKREDEIRRGNPGDPSAGLRISVLVDGKMVSGPSKEQSTVTIRARDSNGGLGIVSVDTTKSDRIPTIQVQQTPAQKP